MATARKRIASSRKTKATRATAKKNIKARIKGKSINKWTPKAKRGWFAAKAAGGELWKKNTATGERDKVFGEDKTATKSAKAKYIQKYLEGLADRHFKRKAAAKRKTATKRKTTRRK
jgi:hypothetical protein